MTSTSQTHRPNRIRPNTVRNRILWVLGQHGIEPATADSIWASLTTGDDPMPTGVPHKFTIHGVTLAWPAGVGTRLIRPDERKALNRALEASTRVVDMDGEQYTIKMDLLDSEDTAANAREAYLALLNRARKRMSELVEEASGPDSELDTPEQRLLRDIFTGGAFFTGTTDDLTDRASELIKLDGVLCGHRKPGGRLLCLNDNHHDGLHANGKRTWTDTEVVVIQHVRATQKPVTATTNPGLDDLIAELDKLTNLLTEGASK